MEKSARVNLSIFLRRRFFEFMKGAPKPAPRKLSRKNMRFSEISKTFTEFSKFGFSFFSNHNFKYTIIHKCLIASPNLCQIVAPNGSLGSFCAKSIFAINLHQKCAPNFVRVAVLRRRSFGNTPSNSPWEKCTS